MTIETSNNEREKKTIEVFKKTLHITKRYLLNNNKRKKKIEKATRQHIHYFDDQVNFVRISKAPVPH